MTELKKYTLLVVDDDEELREILCAIFDTYGFTALAASSGASAFEIVKKQPVDLIVSDMRMADGDGMTLLENIRSRNAEAPILIFVTGYTDVQIEACIKKGAQSVITKPFDQAHLINTVNTALGIS